jgi:hypothetical protein
MKRLLNQRGPFLKLILGWRAAGENTEVRGAESGSRVIFSQALDPTAGGHVNVSPLVSRTGLRETFGDPGIALSPVPTLCPRATVALEGCAARRLSHHNKLTNLRLQ